MNSISFTILRRAASASGAVRAITTTSRGARVLEAAFVAGRGYNAPRFMSGGSLYAVDAPNGDHDLQDVEESTDWVKRVVAVASATEDAAAINESHNAVLGKILFAVDAPDGEHDMEDVEEHMKGVENIIQEASLFENPEEVRQQQHYRDECRKRAIRTSEHDF
ncbi:hypothetical protein ACHAXH_003499 [Discostella pseudostelligera]